MVAVGSVTWFPFDPLKIFVYISHRAARAKSLNRPRFECDYRNWWYWCECDYRNWCNSTQGKSKKHDKVLLTIWKLKLLNLTSFWTGSLQLKYLCLVVIATLRQSIEFHGSSNSIYLTTLFDIIMTPKAHKTLSHLSGISVESTV